MKQRTLNSIRTAFGLYWLSDDLDLPELPELLGNYGDLSSKLVVVASESPNSWPEHEPGPYDTPFVQIKHGDLRLKVEGIGQFRITQGKHIAWFRDHVDVSDQDIRTFLLGSAVGALLIQRGMLVLHGNALEKNGEAIICLGRSGAGKSTLAYTLMTQGWRVLADDLAAVTPQGFVLPGIPRIKLWYDSAQSFGLDPESLPPIRQGMHKYQLMGDILQQAPNAVPLKALYLIHQLRKNLSHSNEGKIIPITSQKLASVRLREQSFRPRFVRGLGQEGSNFVALARLQQSVPVSDLFLPSGIPAMQRWLIEQELLNSSSNCIEKLASDDMEQRYT